MATKATAVRDELVRHPEAVLRPWLKIAGALGALAIAFVAYRAYQETQEDKAWSALARARQQGMSIAALEAARDDSRGSSAEAWVNFHLAFALFEEGGADNFGRAREVATLTLDAHPRHPAAAMLRDLVEAIETYQRPA